MANEGALPNRIKEEIQANDMDLYSKYIPSISQISFLTNQISSPRYKIFVRKENKTMNISIISVVKNDLPGLKRTQMSLERLFPESFEWIVIDSSDQSIDPELLKSERIKELIYVYQKPSGIYSAMNLGVSYSRGKWLWFLNAGDEAILEWKTLEMALEDKNMYAGIAFPVRILNPSGRCIDVIKPQKKINVITKQIELHVNHQGFLFNHQFLSKDPYNLNFQFAADTELIDRLVNLHNIHTAKENLANFYINGSSGQNYKHVLNELMKIRPVKFSVSGEVKKWTYIFKNYLRRKIWS